MTVELTLPGSKSMTQRALIIAALADRPSTIAGALACDDSRHLVAILRHLGVTVETDWGGGRLEVRPAPRQRGRPLASDGAVLDCGNAGTAMRFGTALALVCDGALVLDGDPRMRRRPIGPMGDALRSLGVAVRYRLEDGYPPLQLSRADRLGDEVAVDVSQSSQFASGLLMVAPRLDRGLTLTLGDKRVSGPYLAMTMRMMRRAGVDVTRLDDERIRVLPGAYRWQDAPAVQRIEADWSGAAFILAAAWLTGIELDIANLPSPLDSAQGDARFAAFLEELDRQREHVFDLTDVPDLIAPLAAAALFATHPSTIAGAAHTRVKESDRIAVLVDAFGKLGARIEERPDGMVVQPLRDATLPDEPLDPQNDHRMAMAFGIVSLRVPGIPIANRGCVTKSYPRFWDDLERIRSRIGRA